MAVFNVGDLVVVKISGELVQVLQTEPLLVRRGIATKENGIQYVTTEFQPFEVESIPQHFHREANENRLRRQAHSEIVEADLDSRTFVQ